jgi:ATP-dependent RNA helicase SUPV3L1/SUV3
MKPGAVLWRNALFAALDEQPMIALPDDNAVHLKDWNFAAPEHASRLGFRKVGGEYVRVDMAERLVKQAHEARQVGPVFTIDPALATSLGLSAEIHEELLAMAGFVKTDEVPQVPAKDNAPEAAEAVETAPADAPQPEATVTEVTASDETAPVEDVSAEATTAEAPASEAPAIYWRWKGMAKARSGKPQDHNAKPRGKKPGKKSGKIDSRPRKPEPVLATAGGAFAELAALKETMKK